jgi:hypothetical protein
MIDCTEWQTAAPDTDLADEGQESMTRMTQ